MCCFNAIIFFDFYIFVAILLLRSHITVSGWQCNVGGKNNLTQNCPRSSQTRAFFIYVLRS